LEKLKVLAITQARTGSTRLPGKVLMKFGDETLLQLHLRRISLSKKIDQLIVATTTMPEDQDIVSLSNQLNVEAYCGSVDDVLDRFYKAIQGKEVDYVVRLTSDCPLIDARLIDKIIQYAIDKKLDYCSNTLDPMYPDGQDVEVFKFSALVKAWQEATTTSDREHVTPFIWRNSSYKGGQMFTSDNFQESYAYSHLRMTVDESRDYTLVSKMISELGSDRSWLDYAQYLEQNPAVKLINEAIGRNEGYTESLKKDNK
jgi:spore coat polysaccharide biosynthesis protein SpsF